MTDRIVRAPRTRRELLKLSPLLAFGALLHPRWREAILNRGVRFSDWASARTFRGQHLAPTYRDADVAPFEQFPYNYYDVLEPEIDMASWSLKVDGRVARPGAYDLDRIRQLPRIRQNTRHVCVEGWDVVGSFGGVLLSSFLDLVGAEPSARYVAVSCADGYYESIDLATARHPQTLLCDEMYGKPLDRGHGAPLRLQIPTTLGYKQAKYLLTLSVVDELGPEQSYWGDQGYSWYGGNMKSPGDLVVARWKAGDARLRTAAYEHPLYVRVAHWLTAVSLVVMAASGLQIFLAFPSFGPKIPQQDFWSPPAGITLGGWLAGALQWHFTFMWVFAGAGLIYLIGQIVTGRFRMVLFTPQDIPGVWPMARHYFLRGPRPAVDQPYNPLQKLAYTTTLLLGALSLVSGVALYKSAQFPLLVTLLGGYRVVRGWHFFALCGFAAFVPGHLIMVAIHGWRNFAAMLTGWKREPEYIKDRVS